MPDGVLQPTVTWVADLDKLSGSQKWGDVNFFHPDYEYINRCAYFDYQRRRVFVRTSKRIRRSVRKAGPKTQHNRKAAGFATNQYRKFKLPGLQEYESGHSEATGYPENPHAEN